MSLITRASRGRRYIEIDVSDYLDSDDIELNETELVALRNDIEDARGCLNRPERSCADAMIYLERALAIVERAMRECGVKK